MDSKNIQKFIKEWNDTMNIVYMLTEEILKVTGTVNKEIGRLKNKNENEFINEIQPWFRIAIRSVIATIEAICYKLKQATIIICEQREKTLSPSEMEKLLEKKRDKNGKMKNYYLETRENIKFSLKMFFYVFDLPFTIKDHEGWKKLMDTVAKRHKLTHPKNKTDLEVSPKEYNDASIGFQWFSNSVRELNKLTELKKLTPRID